MWVSDVTFFLPLFGGWKGFQSFDLTSPTRTEKTIAIVYLALRLVDSPNLLSTMKVFPTQGFLGKCTPSA